MRKVQLLVLKYAFPRIFFKNHEIIDWQIILMFLSFEKILIVVRVDEDGSHFLNVLDECFWVFLFIFFENHNFKAEEPLRCFVVLFILLRLINFFPNFVDILTDFFLNLMFLISFLVEIPHTV